MRDIVEIICVGIGIVLMCVILVAMGFISGEVLVWGCEKVGYKVDDVLVRSIWICVYFGVWGVRDKVINKKE